VVKDLRRGVDPAFEISRPGPVARALRFIRDSRCDRFEEIALEVFAFQFEYNAPYRRLCEHRGVLPGRIRSWEEIPAVPAEAFKSAQLTCGPPRHVWRTSGTTLGAGSRGTHSLPELALYDAAWEEPFREHVVFDVPGRIPVVSLIPRARAAPESSLSFMAERIVDRFGSPESRWVLEGTMAEETFRRDASRALSDAVARGEPVLVLATALSLLILLAPEKPDAPRFRLPPGSRLMDTGGFKGRRREATRESMLVLYEERLGLSPTHVVGEYGMTELSSQFYETSLREASRGKTVEERVYEGPPWVRTRALDPETLEPANPGTAGLLVHLDLANAWSVAAVLTDDLGVMREDGFELAGRASGAALRGCSLLTEELLGE
jgi:hypothetical protein